MLSRDRVLDAIKNGRKPECLDGRDFDRLCDFFPVSDWHVLGFRVKDGVTENNAVIKPWTEDTILSQLATDVAFAFKKALAGRGISSSFMFAVVKMWMWILEDDYQSWPNSEYANYGLPLYKAVALKYGLPNEIGTDIGTEGKYDA